MGLDTEELYIQGFSSSMPEDVQIEMLHSVPGLEHAEMTRCAYAIEYDCVRSHRAEAHAGDEKGGRTLRRGPVQRLLRL